MKTGLKRKVRNFEDSVKLAYIRKTKTGATITADTPSYLTDPKYKNLSDLDELDSHDIEMVKEADAHPTKRRKLDDSKKPHEIGIGADDTYSDDEIVDVG